MELKTASKVITKSTPNKGLGCFASKKIFKGEIIEECYLLTLPITPGEPSSLFNDYRFNWPVRGEVKEFVLPLGYGCIYNHSNNNNATWADHPYYKAFQFIALRDIEPGEEICTYYGDDSYWNDGRNHVSIL